MVAMVAVPVHTIKAYERLVIELHSFLTSVLDGSSQLDASVALPPGVKSSQQNMRLREVPEPV
jgi:hypothetical protein